MKTIYIILFALQSLSSIAQDDIYDNPEPVVNNVVPVSSINASDYSDDYNPNFDYRYSRNLRRVYNPYYMMPTTAYMNMYNYPSFNSFYNFNLYGFNSWNDPYFGGFNSWNDPFYNPFNPWGNTIGFGYSPFCNFNNFNNWNNPFIFNSWGGNRPGSNQGWSNPSPPRQVYQNRLPRPTRNQNAGNFGSFSNPSRPNAPAQVVTPTPSNSSRGFFNTTPTNSNSNNSNSNGNSQRNSSNGASFGSGTSSPAPANNNSGGRTGGGRSGRF
jgi:hypothetical protein